MSKIVKINKPVIIKYENRKLELPNQLKEKIKEFWDYSTRENPNLYNGEDYTIEEVKETDECIEMLAIRTDYSHYLYDARVGIEQEKYRDISPWGGILLITNDDYFVIGEMNSTTSVPYVLQIPGGGIDAKDIENGIIDISLNIKRELKEELNLDLENIDYKLEYIVCPDEKRNGYGFLAIGKVNLNKNEVENHFKQYKEYLEKNNLEIEFNKIIFLKRQNALKELDELPNPKRPYLRDLIKETMKDS